jgi:hypothetical protein
MNGRVYDPAVGRFLSVDPRVRDSAASQSWNGYGYVEARLLSATDPSGWETVDCPQCVQYRADPPRSAWVTSVGGYWVGDNSPAWRVLTGSDTIDILAQTPQWVSTGFSWDQLQIVDPGRDPSRRDFPSQTATESTGPAPQGKEDSADPICNAPGLGGGGLTLSQRADLARLQALGGVVGGALLGRLPGAVLGYGAAIGYNAYGLRAGGALVQGGSQQGNLAYGAAAQGLGIPLPAAQRFAGFYEQYGPSSGGRYAPENGTFLGGPPYGDDPGAQQAIAAGYACGQ